MYTVTISCDWRSGCVAFAFKALYVTGFYIRWFCFRTHTLKQGSLRIKIGYCLTAMQLTSSSGSIKRIRIMSAIVLLLNSSYLGGCSVACLIKIGRIHCSTSSSDKARHRSPNNTIMDCSFFSSANFSTISNRRPSVSPAVLSLIVWFEFRAAAAAHRTRNHNLFSWLHARWKYDKISIFTSLHLSSHSRRNRADSFAPDQANVGRKTSTLHTPENAIWSPRFPLSSL